MKTRICKTHGGDPLPLDQFTKTWNMGGRGLHCKLCANKRATYLRKLRRRQRAVEKKAYVKPEQTSVTSGDLLRMPVERFAVMAERILRNPALMERI